MILNFEAGLVKQNELTLGMVENNQFFVSINGDLCQKELSYVIKRLTKYISSIEEFIKTKCADAEQKTTVSKTKFRRLK